MFSFALPSVKPQSNLKLMVLVVFFACVLTVMCDPYAHCPGGQPRIRKEIHDYSDEELDRFFMVLLEFKAKPANYDEQAVLGEDQTANLNTQMIKAVEKREELLSLPRSFTLGQKVHRIDRKIAKSLSLMQVFTERWAQYTQFHGVLADEIQMSAPFLPWYRKFLHQFETELREIDPDFTLPYWSWAYEAWDGRLSTILSDRMFGTSANYQGSNVDVDIGLPIPDGVFANFTTQTPARDYVRRSYKRDIPLKFHGRNCFDQFEKKDLRWGDFSMTLEYFSNMFHNAYGGTMADSAWSPSEPLFFLHHANMDYEWDKWQNLPQNTNPFAYYQPYNAPPASKTDLLPGYDSVQVEDVLDNKALCVEYAAPVKSMRIYKNLVKKTDGAARVAFPTSPSDFSLGLMLGNARGMSLKQLKAHGANIDKMCSVSRTRVLSPAK